MIQSKFSAEDLARAYRTLGIADGNCVYITGNLGKLGLGEFPSKSALLDAHLDAIRAVIGDSGTLVVPTHSFSLCNTDRVFDPATTPSETGPFTNHVMRQPGAIRQFHPFSSRSALGEKAEFICADCSRHSYGMHTPFQRMLELDAKYVSIGTHPRLTVSLVHQCEIEMGVPYRYTKEFMHPVKRNGEVRIEPFYHFVTYLNCDIERNRNQKFFDRYESEFGLPGTEVGNGRIHAFSMRDFRALVNEMLRRNIYEWLEREPLERPYRS